MEDSQQAAPLQAGALETRPDASTAPANSGSAPAGGKAEVDAPHLASFGWSSAAPAFHAGPAEPRRHPSGLANHQAGRSANCNGAAHVPLRPTSAPLAETPKTAGPSAAPQMVKPDGAPIATAPPTPASTDSAPLAETPKPNATPTASAAEQVCASHRRRRSIQRRNRPRNHHCKSLAKSAKASGKPVAQAERQSTEPAPPKEAERSPEPPQDAGNPTAPAPVTAPTVQQRLADGVTHAFGYLMHLPGALVPHLGGP